jgi:FdhD protein
MARASARRRVTRLTVGGEPTARPDTLAGEEPLEIRLDGRPLAVTMRTPGADMDLALGFLLGEGIVGTSADVASMRYCVGTDGAGPTGALDAEGRPTYNVLDVALAPGVPPPDIDPTRNFFTSSSCGLCGKASIDAVRLRSRYRVADDPLRLGPETVTGLPDAMRRTQRLFATTGGLHAAALADAAGRILAVREDVGRHNAVDKVIGWALRDGQVPLRGRVLMVSGRASFELVQKALMAGLPMLAAVSAPSTLAVDLALEAGMTLAGFVRGQSMNVYSGDHRLLAPTLR